MIPRNRWEHSTAKDSGNNPAVIPTTHTPALIIFLIFQIGFIYPIMWRIGHWYSIHKKQDKPNYFSVCSQLSVKWRHPSLPVLSSSTHSSIICSPILVGFSPSSFRHILIAGLVQTWTKELNARWFAGKCWRFHSRSFCEEAERGRRQDKARTFSSSIPR